MYSVILRARLKKRRRLQGLAKRRVKSLRWAASSQASSVAAEPSKSLERRRHLPNHAKVRSTTQRLGRSWKPLTPGGRDDLDRPRPAVRECVEELFAAINPIGEDMFKLWEAASQALQQRHSAMDVLNVGGMNIGRQQETVGVGNDMSLRPWRRLPASNPRGP